MKYLITLFIIVLPIIGFAQDPMLQNDTDELEDQATQITQQYNNELALTSKQFVLFQKKVEEFLIRRETIETKYKGKEKLDLLFTMQEVETREMNDILTRPQLNLYKKIKAKIQPLSVVDKR
ncbi:hypothetical protein [Psychroserpens algicola]|uniref:Uncharacterized protein n=1 Tax=Psychroserpens algicola TaxID=1719034 RepID=A0ABT0HCH2_9FLAO|nr:hypothetical protein [Psychroserpens algicola]MCK8481887.1 hypothetical protein [Psychroserpens algicola]